MNLDTEMKKVLAEALADDEATEATTEQAIAPQRAGYSRWSSEPGIRVKMPEAYWEMILKMLANHQLVMTGSFDKAVCEAAAMRITVALDTHRAAIKVAAEIHEEGAAGGPDIATCA